MADERPAQRVSALPGPGPAPRTRAAATVGARPLCRVPGRQARIGDAPTGAELYDDPQQPGRDVTFGLVLAFREWILQKGYAVGSVNGRLSSVRTFAKLAGEAGAVPAKTAREDPGRAGSQPDDGTRSAT